MSGTAQAKPNKRSTLLAIQKREILVWAAFVIENLGLDQTPIERVEAWGIDLNVLYTPKQIGRKCFFMAPFDEFFAVNDFNRHPRFSKLANGILVHQPSFFRRISPFDETVEETAARRQKFRQPQKSERERIRKQVTTGLQREAAAERRHRIGDLDDRPGAIFEALVPGRWTTVLQIAAALTETRCRAFAGLSGKTLLDTIRRELGRSGLASKVERRKTEAKRPSGAGYAILEVRRV